MNAYLTNCSKLAIALTLSLVGSVTQAATITDLYNTGVDTTISRSTMATGSIDSHYYITTDSVNAVVVDDTTYPFPAWVANNPGAGGSKWVGIQQDSYGRTGPFTYRTNFTIPAWADLNSVVISGLWATDDGLSDIRVNTFSTGNATIGHNVLVPFTINSANGTFVHGTNTLDFDFTNAGGPTGLRIDGIRGTFVPEPTSAATGLIGLAMAGAFRRRS
jgi:MYXO-CTERM domain-containing protein